MGYTLVLLLVVPLLGAVFGALLPTARAARLWALGISLATLALALVAGIVLFADPARPLTFGPDPRNPYLLSIPAIGFSLSLAMDAISFWLVLLTALLTPLAVASSFKSIQDRPVEYYAWMLGLHAAMIGVFLARDLLLFYVFFELTLIPMFFIIGIWGGPQRRRAAGKFFLFTFAGSIFTLAAVVYLGMGAGLGGAPSFDLGDVMRHAQTLPASTRWWVVLGLLAGFAVKVPLFPVHTWLPLAHTEAPTAGSVILAGVLLKLGTYGLLRLAVPLGLVSSAGMMFPGLIHFVGALCVIGILYGALAAWVQPDIKKLVAYSSVSHLGFCVLGLVALNDAGMQGSVLYMINHGLSTGALFLVVGMVYDRYHTRDISELSGLGRVMPRLSFFFVLFALSSIGLPGLNGFVSEFLTILGAFTSPHLGMGFGALAAVGVILGAVYMLHMVARVIFGPLKTPQHSSADSHATADGHSSTHSPSAGAHSDLDGREMSILIPLALAVVLLGVVPTPVLRSMLKPLRDLRSPVSSVNQPASYPAAQATSSSYRSPLAIKTHTTC
jgi:NADH-quinone oxidoreductase subunit M